MSFCINCGQELTEDAKFCANCGKAINESTSTNERLPMYDGEIHKCPNCGDILDAYESVCETCGFEIRGRKSTSVVHELSLKLENTDNTQKKEELIRTFYIPNTKEDIYDFFILALSHVQTGGFEEKAWLIKLEQVYQKARLSFGTDLNSEQLYELYKKVKTRIKINTVIRGFKTIGSCLSALTKNFPVLLLIVGAILLVRAVLFSKYNWMDPDVFIVGIIIFLAGVGLYIPILIKNLKR